MVREGMRNEASRTNQTSALYIVLCRGPQSFLGAVTKQHLLSDCFVMAPFCRANQPDEDVILVTIQLETKAGAYAPNCNCSAAPQMRAGL